MVRIPFALIVAPCAVVPAAPAQAELPPGAQAIIDAALATGDEAKVATALELARAAFPESGPEIDAIAASWNAQLAARKDAATAAEQERIRTAGLLDLWHGQAELGGFQSSGNNDSVGVSASLGLTRKGIQWTHALRSRFDYQRQSGTTSREQVLLAYEPRWQFREDLFVYGLSQFEHDRLQRLAARISVSGGVGYRILDEGDLKLAVKAGPAYRVTDYIDGPTESRVGGLLGLEFEWQPLDRLKLTQNSNAVAETGGQATIFLAGPNSSIDVDTGIEFKISDRLVSRMAYDVKYNSNPPPGAVSTDTLARATLIYGF